MKWPGFVEFDDVNGKVLTYSHSDSNEAACQYKVWGLANYNCLFEVKRVNEEGKKIEEVKIRYAFIPEVYVQ